MVVSSGRRLPWVARVALVGVFGLYGLVALGSGLDRLSAGQPELAALVPSPFAHVAFDTLAQDALSRRNYGEALAYGRKLVARAPAQGNSTSVMAVSAAMGGDTALGERTFKVSAQAGWRQLPVQIYLMHAAAAQGDYTRAVRHLDAILRQSAGLHHYPALIDVIENNVAAQDAFEKLLMTRPPWFDVYTNDVGALSAEGLSVRALILADLHDRGMSLGCDGIDAITHELVLRHNS